VRRTAAPSPPYSLAHPNLHHQPHLTMRCVSRHAATSISACSSTWARSRGRARGRCACGGRTTRLTCVGSCFFVKPRGDHRAHDRASTRRGGLPGSVRKRRIWTCPTVVPPCRVGTDRWYDYDVFSRFASPIWRVRATWRASPSMEHGTGGSVAVAPSGRRVCGGAQDTPGTWTPNGTRGSNGNV
jgi:hypothetical protein